MNTCVWKGISCIWMKDIQPFKDNGVYNELYECFKEADIVKFIKIDRLTSIGHIRMNDRLTTH